MSGWLIILILLKIGICNMYMYIRLRRISNLVRLEEGEREGGRKRGREEEREVVNPSPLYQGYIQ